MTLYRAYDASLGRWLSEDPTKLAGGINLSVYSENRPINGTDPLGLDTYLVNRGLKVTSKSRGDATRRLNPFSHTFVVTTTSDGSVEKIYSWRNPANEHGWNSNQPEDVRAARQALEEGLGERVGKADLDPYITDAFNELNTPENDHLNLFICNNCKSEAMKLVELAKHRQRQARKYVEPNSCQR